jgi:hypothetical protein
MRIVLQFAENRARLRCKGAIMTGAILSAFAPDHTLAARIRPTEESRQT